MDIGIVDQFGDREIQVILKNKSGREISSISLNVFQEDLRGNIVDSKNMYWSGPFKDGATQLITKFVHDYEGCNTTYTVCVGEVYYK